MKVTRRVFIQLTGSAALMVSAPTVLAQGLSVKRLPLPCSPAEGKWIDRLVRDALNTVLSKFLIRMGEPQEYAEIKIRKVIMDSAAQEDI